jgi:hypothetical protein
MAICCIAKLAECCYGGPKYGQVLLELFGLGGKKYSQYTGCNDNEWSVASSSGRGALFMWNTN